MDAGPPGVVELVNWEREVRKAEQALAKSRGEIEGCRGRVSRVAGFGVGSRGITVLSR